jgi:hypothetical protein
LSAVCPTSTSVKPRNRANKTYHSCNELIHGCLDQARSVELGYGSEVLEGVTSDVGLLVEGKVGIRVGGLGRRRHLEFPKSDSTNVRQFLTHLEAWQNVREHLGRT